LITKNIFAKNHLIMKKTIKMANVISSDIRSRKNADKIHAMIAPGDEWKV
jgi:hypothetical protein